MTTTPPPSRQWILAGLTIGASIFMFSSAMWPVVFQVPASGKPKLNSSSSMSIVCAYGEGEEGGSGTDVKAGTNKSLSRKLFDLRVVYRRLQLISSSSYRLQSDYSSFIWPGWRVHRFTCFLSFSFLSSPFPLSNFSFLFRHENWFIGKKIDKKSTANNECCSIVIYNILHYHWVVTSSWLSLSSRWWLRRNTFHHHW